MTTTAPDPVVTLAESDETEYHRDVRVWVDGRFVGEVTEQLSPYAGPFRFLAMAHGAGTVLGWHLSQQSAVAAIVAVDKLRHRETTHRVVAPEPTTWTCVARRCGGAHFTGMNAADAAAWMDLHATEPHDPRWPISFRIDYPGRTTPGADYRDAATS